VYIGVSLVSILCITEHLSTWRHCLAALGFLSNTATVLRHTAKETFCRYQHFGWADTSVSGVVTEDLMSSLKMETARCTELAPTLRYIPEEGTLQNITSLLRCFGISSSIISALKIDIFIVTSFGRLATSIRIANAYL